MPKVLIADDEPRIRRLWAVNLLVRSYDVVEASNGRECLNLVEVEKPDVILLDLTMPVLSGWGVLELLHGKPEISRIPIIILTGWADAEIKEKARSLGASGALVKPFGVEELLFTIEMTLKEK